MTGVVQEDVFLLILLPAIMADAGLSLNARPCLRNVGGICAFAFAGTVISAFATGLLMWGFGAAGWCTQLGLVYNLLFGSIIAATDPVRRAGGALARPGLLSVVQLSFHER